MYAIVWILQNESKQLTSCYNAQLYQIVIICANPTPQLQVEKLLSGFPKSEVGVKKVQS